MASPLVLIVDDDPELRRLMELDLKRNDYRVETASTGFEGLARFRELSPSLVVLDVDMPGMTGFEVCQQIRETSNVPILIMTAHAVSEQEIAEGLNKGADEYMIKPLGKIEFHARVRALLRRMNMNEENQKDQITRFDDGYLYIDLPTRIVKIDGKETRLTPTEFKLIANFIANPQKVLSFKFLLERVWGAEYQDEHHYPRIYVSHLRRKIEQDVKDPQYIQNEYGVGYRFIGVNQESTAE